VVSREKLDGTQSGLLEDGVTRAPFAPDVLADDGEMLTDAIAVRGGYAIVGGGFGMEAARIDQTPQSGLLNIAASAGYNQVTGFVVTGDTIYLGEAADNQVDKIALSFDPDAAVPPEATPVVKGQKNPSQFVADDAWVYWRTDDCLIMRLAK
jgi:hypothetical protein